VKRRAVVLTLLAIVALCASAGGASSASATPAFGICKKEAGGKYEVGNCTIKAIGSFGEKYEWYPVLGGEKAALTDAAFSLSFAGEPIVFESKAGATVECAAGSGAGDFSEHQIEGLTREVEGVVVTYSGVIVTHSLDGILGDWKKETEKRHDKIGIAFYPQSKEEDILSAKCGSTEYQQKGAVIDQVNSNEINEPMEEIRMKFVVTKSGEQRPLEFLTGEPEVAMFESNFGSWSQTGMTAQLTLKTNAEGEAVEARVGVNGT